jgi:beta-glucosidase
MTSLSPTDDLPVDAQARLTSGHDFWTTKPEGSLPSILMTDGPHGLRRQSGATDNLGISGSEPATCFPPAAGLAQSWDRTLARRVGAAIADEARAQGVSIVLGPGVNLKRSPRGGRNFEYYSEDPHLTAALGGSWVHGLQSRGIGASLKHFAVNNQETDRMRISADVDERSLHELYLRAFRQIVIDEQPWTVMCSYNRINGVHAAHNRELLTEILRESWGFDGVVVSDWGAVAERVRSIAAGLDLTMPFPGPRSDERVAAAVAEGTLDAGALRAAARRVVALVERATASTATASTAPASTATASTTPASTATDAPTAPVDLDAHHALAREAAAASIVLLRNDDALLPLSTSERIGVIGALASQPRYQGGGSSHVNATRVDMPLDEIGHRADGDVPFAEGYRLDGTGDPGLSEEAVTLARSVDTVLLFLGLADRQESEGFDRTDIDLPADQIALAAAVTAANPRTVIVLAHGGVLAVAPLEAPAILDGALLGQAVGSAVADVVFGEVNPSGRLAETIPMRIEDTADFLNFPGESGHVHYGEGLFIGYRWYDARDLDVAFPFGHGLSYTSFDYADLRVSVDAEATIEARVTVTNTGRRRGREVVQLYIGVPGSAVSRPIRELRGFADIVLDPGQSGDATIVVEPDELAYWDIRAHRFVVESGAYDISVGASSRDIRVTAMVDIVGDQPRIPLTMESSVAEVLADPVAAEGMAPIVGAMFDGADSGEGMDLVTIMGSVPVGRIVDFSAGLLPPEVLRDILDRANAAH